MSDADRLLVRYQIEGTFDTAPGGTYQEARITSFGITPNFSHTESQEIRSDRQVSNIVRTGFNSGGAIGTELSYTSHDDWIRSVLQSVAATAEVTVADITISAASSDNSFNDTNSGFGSIAAGDWIRTSGFSDPANNGRFRVVTATAAKLVVAGGTLVDESAGSSFTIKSGARMQNGTTQESYHIEAEYTDQPTTSIDRFGGQTPGSFSLTVPESGQITGSFVFSGASWLSDQGSSDASVTTAATTTDSTSAVFGTSILENDVAYAANGFTLSVENSLRERRSIGSEAPTSYGAGRCRVSGTLQAYFAQQAAFTRLQGDTDTSLALLVQDRAGNDMIFWIPRVTLSGGRKIAGSAESDILAEFDFLASRDQTDDETIVFVSIGA